MRITTFCWENWENKRKRFEHSLIRFQLRRKKPKNCADQTRSSRTTMTALPCSSPSFKKSPTFESSTQRFFWTTQRPKLCPIQKQLRTGESNLRMSRISICWLSTITKNWRRTTSRCSIWRNRWRWTWKIWEIK